jgi:hypothetical protein
MLWTGCGLLSLEAVSRSKSKRWSVHLTGAAPTFHFFNQQRTNAGYTFGPCIDSSTLLPTTLTLPTLLALTYTTTPLSIRRQHSSPSWRPGPIEIQAHKENTSISPRPRPTAIPRRLARSKVVMPLVPTLIAGQRKRPLVSSTKEHRMTPAMRKMTTFEWPRTMCQTTRSVPPSSARCVQYSGLTRHPHCPRWRVSTSTSLVYPRSHAGGC